MTQVFNVVWCSLLLQTVRATKLKMNQYKRVIDTYYQAPSVLSAICMPQFASYAPAIPATCVLCNRHKGACPCDMSPSVRQRKFPFRKRPLPFLKDLENFGTDIEILHYYWKCFY